MVAPSGAISGEENSPVPALKRRTLRPASVPRRDRVSFQPPAGAISGKDNPVSQDRDSVLPDPGGVTEWGGNTSGQEALSCLVLFPPQG